MTTNNTHRHTPSKHFQTNIRWGRNTKYSLLNIQNLWNRVASRIVNFPILHPSLNTSHQLHNQRRNTISLNLNRKLGKWKTWRRTFILALRRGRVTLNVSTVVYALAIDVAQQNWDDETIWDVFVCFKLTGKYHRCGVKSKPSASITRAKVQYGASNYTNIHRQVQ